MVASSYAPVNFLAPYYLPKVSSAETDPITTGVVAPSSIAPVDKDPHGPRVVRIGAPIGRIEWASVLPRGLQLQPWGEGYLCLMLDVR